MGCFVLVVAVTSLITTTCCVCVIVTHKEGNKTWVRILQVPDIYKPSAAAVGILTSEERPSTFAKLSDTHINRLAGNGEYFLKIQSSLDSFWWYVKVNGVAYNDTDIGMGYVKSTGGSVEIASSETFPQSWFPVFIPTIFSFFYYGFNTYAQHLGSGSTPGGPLSWFCDRQWPPGSGPSHIETSTYEVQYGHRGFNREFGDPQFVLRKDVTVWLHSAYVEAGLGEIATTTVRDAGGKQCSAYFLVYVLCCYFVFFFFIIYLLLIYFFFLLLRSLGADIGVLHFGTLQPPCIFV